MLLSDWLLQAQTRLENAGVESARLEAQVLAAHVAGKDRAWVLAHPEAKVSQGKLEKLVSRREQREPLAYILGYREFFGRRFIVTPDVLIPRQETETLVETVLDCVPDSPQQRVLDLGTGSGCIAITLSRERPRWEVIASDDSESALQIAQRNAQALRAKVRFIQADLLDEMYYEWPSCIVSNPPYVQTGAALEPEVGLWEPKEALFAGADGLEVYRRIATDARRCLMPQGLLILEVGDAMAETVSALFATEGWRNLRTVKDLSGMDRVLVLAQVNPVEGQ